MRNVKNKFGRQIWLPYYLGTETVQRYNNMSFKSPWLHMATISEFILQRTNACSLKNVELLLQYLAAKYTMPIFNPN